MDILWSLFLYDIIKVDSFFKNKKQNLNKCEDKIVIVCLLTIRLIKSNMKYGNKPHFYLTNKSLRFNNKIKVETLKNWTSKIEVIYRRLFSVFFNLSNSSDE